MLVAAKYGLGMISGDIGDDFCTALCAKKIWSVAGEQFGERKGNNCSAKAGAIWIKDSISFLSQ
eukprot:11187025-Ditylum_brightwellii.AAC.1